MGVMRRQAGSSKHTRGWHRLASVPSEIKKRKIRQILKEAFLR